VVLIDAQLPISATNNYRGDDVANNPAKSTSRERASSLNESAQVSQD
jgi:hypothetical protein